MFYLNVPYNDRDVAKGLGAKWDGQKRSWFVPPDVDLEPFSEWVKLEDLEEATAIIESQKPEKGIKLSALIVKVKKAVEEKVAGTYWINAEIANLKEHKGSLYLLLAEMDSNGKEVCTNRAIVWSNTVSIINEKFKSETGNTLVKGLKVLVKVKVTYEMKHQLSLVVLDIDPSFTLGGMEAKIKKIRDRVVALGLYDKNKNHKTPFYFRNIAVVSPAEAAGLGDFKADADLLEKNKICKFNYYTAVFQGNTTAKTVSDAIKKASFDSLEKKYDAIVVIRGGGAKTDLHFLNEFDIAKQIAESKVPVFVGVGHEIDKVFIDEIAFRSFDTPSKVIGFISNNNTAIYKKFKTISTEIDHSSNRLFESINKSLKSSTSLISANAESLILKYKSRLNERTNDINENSLKIKSNYKMKLENCYSNIKITSNSLRSNVVMSLDDKVNTIKMLSNNKTKSLQSDLDLKYNNIINNAQLTVSSYKGKLNKITSEIDNVSPLNALNNGFAIIKSKKGDIIKTVKDLEKEKSFIVWLSDGEKEFKNEEK